MRNIELTFERRLPHPRTNVWRALTESDHLRAWFVRIIDYDRSRLDFADGAKPGWEAGLDALEAHLERV